MVNECVYLHVCFLSFVCGDLCVQSVLCVRVLVFHLGGVVFGGSVTGSQICTLPYPKSQVNPPSTLPSYLPEIRFNVIVPFTPRSSIWSPFFGVFYQVFCAFLFIPIRVSFLYVTYFFG